MDVKNKIFSKGIKAIPNAVWVICASYALIVITTVLALNFAHIDADKHINRYFDIMLNEQELSQRPNKRLESKVNELIKEVKKLREEVNNNTELAHESGVNK